MKKNLIFAGILFVTGISQLSAQEKEEKLIPEVTIATKAKQQLHKTGKNVQLLSSKDLEIKKKKIIDLISDEIKELNQLIAPSSKTEEASLPKAEPTRRKIEFLRRDDSKFRRK